MCSIVGYIGTNYSREAIMQGLERLEYRGYDSAGFACLDPEDARILYLKSEGSIDNLLSKCKTSPINGFSGIGHTRWATHGISTAENAHPHFDCKKNIAIVHNGIIENYLDLKAKLQESGHVFYSQTDTETLAHLLEDAFDKLPVNTALDYKNYKNILVNIINKLHGAYTFAAILTQNPDLLIAVRKSSPLCIGIADNGYYIASDQLAFADKVKQVVFLPDQSFALITKNSLKIFSFDGQEINYQPQSIDAKWLETTKNGHAHYMLKEIYEQKKVIYNTVNFLRSINNKIWSQLNLTQDQISKLTEITFIGCGTSYNAGKIAQFFFEVLCRIRCNPVLASEYKFMPILQDQNSLFMTISQSGETADTLEVLRLLHNLQYPTVTLTNVASSSMVREADGFLLTQAGQEIAVASTKSFTAQVSTLFWLAHKIATEKKLISQQQLQIAEEELLKAAEVLENSIEQYKQEIDNIIAPYYAKYSKAIFLGRNISYPFALEAALKLKEIAYIFTDCYPAGELKHGPIALIDPETPVFIFSVLDPIIYQKIVTSAQEIKARSGHIITFAFEGQHELINLADQAFIFPKVHSMLAPIAMTGVMQYLVYKIALILGRAIDKPRNLAKSVTVE